MSGAARPSAPGSRNWKLDPKIASDVQGLVVSGFNDLPAALALFLFSDRPGGAWLKALLDVAPVTAADAKQAPAVALAFTKTGLDLLGLEALTSGFDRPFVEGMMQEDRRRRLGDSANDGAVSPAVCWSGGSPAADGRPIAVHALLLLYETSHEALVDHSERVQRTLRDAGVRVVREKPLDLRLDERGMAREHFGFADGISQPIPFGEGTCDATGAPCPRDPLHGVPLGEILLGFGNAHGQRSTGPSMTGTALPDGTFSQLEGPAREAAAHAVHNPGDVSVRDLGLHGSYLVVRELHQDVEGFWRSLEDEARRLNAQGAAKPPVDAGWLAERIMGRTRDGHALAPDAPLPAGADGPDNDFLFFLRDRLGYGCPLGSHVRRANPRDGLAFDEAACGDMLTSANAHRILRRGRKFGGDLAQATKDDESGLLFMCLNTDIARQFEFVQQNWLLNPNFATLYDEVDPLVGPAGMMSLPDRPMRRRFKVERYVTLVGGDYFFLPSLPTLRILASL